MLYLQYSLKVVKIENNIFFKLILIKIVILQTNISNSIFFPNWQSKLKYEWLVEINSKKIE